MNVLVFCSAQDIPEKYTKAASEFASLVARNGHTLVWGGSDRGTMKTIADAAQAEGGKIVGISMELLKHNVRRNTDELYIGKDLAERKRLMLERSDAIVVLAGGIGTLDEATEVLALKRHRYHNKPVVFLDTGGFYYGMRTQLARMEEEGFLKNMDKDTEEETLFYFAETPEEVMRYIEGNGN